jgi:pectin methylesterase-like acyl-CoA thioesterase
MNSKLFFLVILFACLGINLGAQSKPYNADILVALDGSGDFIKIQDAINAVPSNSDRRTIIYIKRGLYNTEKLIVPADKKNVTFIGESRDETIISYHIYDCTGGLNNKCPAEDAAKWDSENMRTSATLTIAGEGFKAENLTLQNTAGPVGQALAITVKADKCIFINCNILGYQDTIYLWDAGKRSYFQNCLVVGRTDYIYGAGIAFFQGCEIRSWGGGWITAPSTPRNQPYGYVFNQCEVSYATGSPRAGDDGALVALGRPWHEYPKVAWLHCNMTEKIDPLGWPTKWNMDYADTSIFLKLLEYQNTGVGANMSGRAAWVGIRAMTDLEAPDFTVQKVMAGSDNWDPTAEPPTVVSYSWTGGGATNGWRLPENWNPAGIPGANEAANVIIADTINANGDTIKADLALYPKTAIDITSNSTVSYLSLDSAEIMSLSNATLNGKIATKNVNKITVNTNTLTINAAIVGVHNFTKHGLGKLVLAANNINYSGSWIIVAGTIEASAENSLGKGNTTVHSGGKLIIDNDKAFQPKSKLNVVTGALLELNASVYLSEFYIDGVMQAIGEYDAVSNPALISGTGKIIVGRPTVFTFVGGANGNWDVATSFVPAILPIAGDTVLVGREIETTSTSFVANMILEANKGKIRPRGNHTSTGWVIMNAGTSISYATSSNGFTLTFAEMRIQGNIGFYMNTNHSQTNSHILTLPGTISSNESYTITLTHPRSGLTNALVVNAVLGGDNSNLSCNWDVTTASLSEAAGCYICLKGTGANSLGKGAIAVGSNNKVSFDHAQCIGSTNDIVLLGSAKAILNANVTAKSIQLGGITYTNGTFNATTHPSFFEGTGNLTVGTTSIKTTQDQTGFYFKDRTLYFSSVIKNLQIFDLTGRQVLNENINGRSKYLNLNKGLYIVKAEVDNSRIFKILIED